MNEKLNELFKQREHGATRRHIFLCCDQMSSLCSTKEEGLRSWGYLKNRLNELKLTGEGGIRATHD